MSVDRFFEVAKFAEVNDLFGFGVVLSDDLREKIAYGLELEAMGQDLELLHHRHEYVTYYCAIIDGKQWDWMHTWTDESDGPLAPPGCEEQAFYTDRAVKVFLKRRYPTP
jgi:hypothetical protein